MNFDQKEKLAVVKALTEAIHVDEKYRVGELVYLDKLMKELDFDARFMELGSKLDAAEAIEILKGMTESKKRSLIIMINEMTEADGVVDSKEMDFMINLLNILQ